MNKTDEVQSYLKSLSPGHRAVLGALRELILTLVPNLEERLSRGVPFFYYFGKRAVGYRSSKNHLSIFIMEGNVLHDLRSEMTGFDNSSTVVRFTTDKPLPKKLIEKLVLARIAEIDKTLSKKKKRNRKLTTEKQ